LSGAGVTPGARAISRDQTRLSEAALRVLGERLHLVILK
jgi:hypothetical protein